MSNDHLLSNQSAFDSDDLPINWNSDHLSDEDCLSIGFDLGLVDETVDAELLAYFSGALSDIRESQVRARLNTNADYRARARSLRWSTIFKGKGQYLSALLAMHDDCSLKAPPTIFLNRRDKTFFYRRWKMTPVDDLCCDDLNESDFLVEKRQSLTIELYGYTVGLSFLEDGNLRFEVQGLPTSNGSAVQFIGSDLDQLTSSLLVQNTLSQTIAIDRLPREILLFGPKKFLITLEEIGQHSIASMTRTGQSGQSFEP